MPKAHPVELRGRIVAAVQRGQTIDAVAERFQVSPNSIDKLLHKLRTTGSIEPRPFAGGRREALGPYRDEVAKLVEQHPDATLAELLPMLPTKVSIGALARTLSKLGLSRKKRASTPLNRTGQMSRKLAGSGVRRSQPLIRLISSSSTKRGSRPT